MKFVATILIEVADVYKGRKPDIVMVLRYLDSIIYAQPVNNENAFRGKIIFNLLQRNISLMQIE